MSAQIDIDGNVAIIHSVDSNTVKERVKNNSGTYFGAEWLGGPDAYPKAASNCGDLPNCQIDGTTCLCSTLGGQTTAVFDGSQLPTTSQLISDLHIGASDPSLFDTGHYHLCTAAVCSQSGYNIYSRTLVETDGDIALAFDEETIFEVTTGSTTLFLSNTKSIVPLGDGYEFRNPPMYNSPVSWHLLQEYGSKSMALNTLFSLLF